MKRNQELVHDLVRCLGSYLVIWASASALIWSLFSALEWSLFCALERSLFCALFGYMDGNWCADVVDS